MIIADTNEKINGKYNRKGYFIVDEAERYVPGRCDEDGYLLDKNGSSRYRNIEIKERKKQRSFMKNQRFLKQ